MLLIPEVCVGTGPGVLVPYLLGGQERLITSDADMDNLRKE